MTSDDSAIYARGLDKRYRLYGRPSDRVKEWITRKTCHQEVWALKGIDLDVPRGSGLGLVGSNGAGKSTLLKILSGTSVPSAGTFEVRGKVASLLELGTGFYPGFSGYQNIFLNGMVMGFSRKEMEARVDEIVDFSELGDFIHQPIRTYSSGMIMRLGFSVATAIDPEVLIIDEILAVGDLHFQKKCIDRIMSFREKGKTILFCSHSLYHVEEICDQAVWVQKGEIRMRGPAGDVCRSYEKFERSRRMAHGSPGVATGFEIGLPDETGEVPSPTGAANAEEEDVLPFSGTLPQVTEVRLLTPDGQPSLVKNPETGDMVPGSMTGRDLVIEMDYELPEDLDGMLLGCIVYGSDQLMLSGMGTQMHGFDPPKTKGHYTAKLTFPGFPVLHGEYKFNLYLADERGLHVYHSNSNVGKFLIEQDSRHIGVIKFDHHWSVERRTRTAETVDAGEESA